MAEAVFPGGLTRVDYSSFLAQHDVVYLAPAVDGFDGLPLGNGDLGAILWTPPDQLRLQVNKVDLVDDGPDAPLDSWADGWDEVSTMLRHAATLSIGNVLRSYDRVYLTDFEARLRLADARVELRSQTPFARASVEAFASEAGVLVLRYRDATDEPVARTLTLERWGTRSFIHWYRQIKRDVPVSLLATDAGCDDRHLWITQELRRLPFAVALRSTGAVRARRPHRRAALFESEPVTAFEDTLYLAVVSSEEASDPLAAAIARVDDAARRGATALEDAHRRSWGRFWEASFVDLPPAQDYLENLWYLNSYYQRSSSRGRLPPNHIDAVWSSNRDVRPWVHYYHWNTQIQSWPLHSSGHPELAEPYFRWRRGMLERAVADARRVHGRAGAFYTDVCDVRGNQATEAGLSHNLTPGAQIAADFWRHYAYTRDAAFLRESAYPVIREAARFYLETLEERPDGLLTVRGTQAYEGNVYLDDCLTDLAHARQLFGIFVEASRLCGEDADLRARCENALSRLAPYPVMAVSTRHRIDPDSAYDKRPVLFDEVRPGDPTMPIWFLGYRSAGQRAAPARSIPEGAPVHEGLSDPRKLVWLFAGASLAPVFPASQVGLDQAGNEELEVARNTLRAFGEDAHAFNVGGVAEARLGLGAELIARLETWPPAFQVYPQGFTHYFIASHPDMELDHRYLKKVQVAGSPGEQIDWPIALSNHMSLEAGPMLQFCLNEMLLQSHAGAIRVFPAVPADWEGEFRLHAVGRFVVSARRAAGRASHLLVESRGGEECRVVNPWPGEPVTVFEERTGWAPAAELGGERLIFPTRQGGLYLLLPQGVDPGTLPTRRIDGQPNAGAKYLGRARLGIPRGF